MTTVMEETALSTRTEQSFELAPTAAAAEKQFEIQSAIIIARRFPRNEDAAFEKLMKACRRVSFAEDAAYAFPRGGEQVTGPSVNLAREGARVWGNIRHGLDVIRDDENGRQIRGWAWDLETNVKVTAEDEFAKLIFRKKGGWQKPDERDLRELTNRRGAILVRNCILQLLPRDLIEDAQLRAQQTIREGAESDPEATRKKLIMSFSGLNVTPEMLAEKLGHPLSQCSPKELADLRTIYKSIADGNSTWADYMAGGHGNGEEPRRKSDAQPIATEPTAGATTEEKPAAATEGFPIDLSKTFKVAEVNAAAKKGGPFSIVTSDGHKLQSADARLYIAAQSAKQTGAAVILDARMADGVLILTGIEEMA